MENAKRVKIWNPYFKLTRTQAGALWEIWTKKKISRKVKFLGGTLSEEEFHAFAMLALCCLAIEARANHLIEELLEQGKISDADAQQAFQLPAGERWFLIPSRRKCSQRQSKKRSSRSSGFVAAAIPSRVVYSQ